MVQEHVVFKRQGMTVLFHVMAIHFSRAAQEEALCCSDTVLQVLDESQLPNSDMYCHLPD